MTNAPLFVFKMRAVARPTDPYYVTRWDRATPVEVVAATKQEAINKADATLGSAGAHRYWVFRVDSVRDVLIPTEATT
ncbi:hypothetical protein [Microbacterium jejuense]|uniref:hypothetical protein n=1 Tax=Microbacterium jejuense TaxID=1263637 RepID=UPI0031EFEFAA